MLIGLREVFIHGGLVTRTIEHNSILANLNLLRSKQNEFIWNFRSTDKAMNVVVGKINRQSAEGPVQSPRLKLGQRCFQHSSLTTLTSEEVHV